MRFVVVRESTGYPTWFFKLYLIYFFTGYACLNLFTEDTIAKSSILKNIISEISRWLPGVSVSVSSFPLSRSIYMIFMLLAMIISVMCFLFTENRIPLSLISSVSIKTFLIRIFTSFFLSLFVFFVFFYYGIHHVNAEVSRAKILEFMLNGTKIGMAFTGAGLCETIVLLIHLFLVNSNFFLKTIFYKDGHDGHYRN